MNKKHLIIMLTVLIMFPIIGNQVCAQDLLEESPFDDIRILNFPTTTNITIDTKKLADSPMQLNPGDSINDIEATVKFKFDTPSFFPNFLIGTKIGNWVIFREIEHNMSATINLESENPDWIIVDLPDKITINNIGTSFKETTFKFNVTVNKTALALQEGGINIKAIFKPDQGLEGSDASDSFEISTNYVGELEARFNLSTNQTTVNFEAGQTKILELEIINLYNAETIVYIQPSEEITKDKIWNLTLPQKQITLKPGKTGIMKLNITAKESDSYNNKETVFDQNLIVLTPKVANNQTVQGTQLTVHSPKLVAEGKSTMMEDIIMIILYAILILIIVIIIIIVILKIIKR